jgi:ferredoxin
MTKYKVNKQKCVGCGICTNNCREAIGINNAGKAIIINQDQLKACGGESVCPKGAIERVEEQ